LPRCGQRQALVEGDWWLIRVALNGAATSSTTGAYTLKSACWTAAACAST